MTLAIAPDNTPLTLLSPPERLARLWQIAPYDDEAVSFLHQHLPPAILEFLEQWDAALNFYRWEIAHKNAVAITCVVKFGNPRALQDGRATAAMRSLSEVLLREFCVSDLHIIAGDTEFTWLPPTWSKYPLNLESIAIQLHAGNLLYRVHAGAIVSAHFTPNALFRHRNPLCTLSLHLDYLHIGRMGQPYAMEFGMTADRGFVIPGDWQISPLKGGGSVVSAIALSIEYGTNAEVSA